MNITGTTRVFLIIGDPVAQVRAPEVYNHLFRRHAVDAVVVPARISREHVAGFVRHILLAGNVGGLWVTIPHKAAVLSLADRSDPIAQLAGAANAVRRNADGSIEVALFDGVGFVKGLDHLGIDIVGRRALVVGAGGGGHAVAAALAQRGVAHLAVYNRTGARAADLVSRLAPTYGKVIAVAPDSDPAGFDLVVNCTSLGLKVDDALPLDVTRVDPGAAVVDIIMTRQPTPLLQACRARGIQAHAGFEMLVQQVPEYLRFFGMPEIARTLQEDMAEVRQLLYPR
jgi:shikimate dehydrogenase